MKLFIAQTIDGFIAGADGSLDHLQPFHGNDYGYDAHIASVDAVVLGRGTFDAIYPVHGWPYPPRLRGVVMTSRPLPDGTPESVVAASDPDAVAREFPTAYVDGGGETIRMFLERGHLTEARLFTLPILLGRGVRLFPDGAPSSRRWALVESRAFPCGTVLHHYRV